MPATPHRPTRPTVAPPSGAKPSQRAAAVSANTTTAAAGAPRSLPANLHPVLTPSTTTPLRTLDINTVPATPKKQQGKAPAETTVPAVDGANRKAGPVVQSVRKQRRSPAKLSPSDRLRRQRLQLLQLARHGASVAAALVLSESHHRLGRTPSLTAAATERVTTAAEASSGKPRTAQPKAESKSGNDAASAGGKVKRSTKRVTEAASATTAPPSATDAPAPGAAVKDASAAAAAAAAPNTAVPSSYAELWGALMQLPLAKPTEAASGALPYGETTEGMQITELNTASATTGNHSSNRRPSAMSLSALADQLQELNTDWRECFVKGAVRTPTSSAFFPSQNDGRHGLVPGGAPYEGLRCLDRRFGSRCSLSAAAAFSPLLAEDELFTLRCYTVGWTKGKAERGSSDVNAAYSQPRPSAAESRYLLSCEPLDSVFGMDYF